MPGEWARVGEFRKLLLLRALRPDRITNALQVSGGVAGAACGVSRAPAGAEQLCCSSNGWGWTACLLM